MLVVPDWNDVKKKTSGKHVRMAEWSKVLRSGRSPLLWAGVRISLLTNTFCINDSRVAQWKRAGPITQRSVDRNYALLKCNLLLPSVGIPSTTKSLQEIMDEIQPCPISAEDSALDF